MACAIERFTGVCVLVLEANIGSFILLRFPSLFTHCPLFNPHARPPPPPHPPPPREPAPAAPPAAPHPAVQHSLGGNEQAHPQRCVAAAHTLRYHLLPPSRAHAFAPSHAPPPSPLPAAPVGPDVDYDALGQFELGAAGIAAAVLRGAATASLRQQLQRTAGEGEGGKAAVGAAAAGMFITQKDFEEAARAQLRVTESELSKFVNAAYT